MQTISAMEIRQKSSRLLTSWIRFHDGNISNENQEEVHITHSLERISCNQYQQYKSSRGATDDSLPG
jgi:hypothetical protein